MADIIKLDIADINLNGGSVHRSFECANIGLRDTLANRFGVRLLRDGYDVPIGDGTVEGIFLPHRGDPILISGELYTGVNGNVAWVQLPQACYNCDGVFSLVIKVIAGGITSTMRIVDGIVAAGGDYNGAVDLLDAILLDYGHIS